MKKVLNISALLLVVIVATSCSSSRITKGQQYAKLYEEKPVVLLVMPPINNTTNVEAKDLLFTSVSEPLAEAGYYVIPPLMAMDVLRNESAYDAEQFIDAPLGAFREYFGADAVVFPKILSWRKILTSINTEVSYIVKSTTTNEVLFERTCNLTISYNTNNHNKSLLGTLVSIAAATVEAAATDHIEAARIANKVIFEDLPYGKYHPHYMQDMEDSAQPEFVSRTVNR